MKIANKMNTIGRNLAHSAILFSVLTAPAFAQLEKAQKTLTNVQLLLIGVSAVSVTIAIMYAGYKMIFQHSKWQEVSNIVLGSIMIGGASGFASWLLN